MKLDATMMKIRETAKGKKNVFFVGCGGSLADLYPGKYLIDSEAKSLKAFHISSNEFVHATPNAFGTDSILIVCSHQGNTPETVEAARIGKEKGAMVIAFTNTEGSPLTEYGTFNIKYEFGADVRAELTKMGTVLRVAFELLSELDSYDHYSLAVEGFQKIHDLAIKARTETLSRAEAFAQEHVNDKNIYVIGSGSSYGVAYSYSICILMEMQWINSSSIHSGEFFHGPFEITDDKIPFILLKGAGRTRPLDERAHSFINKYGKRITVLDAEEMGISQIAPEVVEFFNPLLLNIVLRSYAEHLATARNHPLSTRRYMWKVEY